MLFKEVSQWFKPILWNAVEADVENDLGALVPNATKTPKVRGLRAIKKEILKLIDNYIEQAEDMASVDQNMIGPFFEAVLLDYRESVDITREAEVLNVLATMVNKLGVCMNDNNEAHTYLILYL